MLYTQPKANHVIEKTTERETRMQICNLTHNWNVTQITRHIVYNRKERTAICHCSKKSLKIYNMCLV